MSDYFPLQPSTGATLYSQLASVLRGRITRGEWKIGDQIPTLDELSDTYGVARVSAKQAVQMLVSEGLLSARRGRRTTVVHSGLYERTLSTGVAAPLEQLPGFNARILSEVRDLSLPSFAEGLGQPEKAYVRITKVDSDGQNPYAFSSIHVAQDLFNLFPVTAAERLKVSRLVRSVNKSPLISARERISVSSANPEEAAALKCPLAAPIAVVQRVYVDARGYVVYAGWSTYSSDRFLVDRELLELVHGEVRLPASAEAATATAASGKPSKVGTPTGHTDPAPVRARKT